MTDNYLQSRNIVMWAVTYQLESQDQMSSASLKHEVRYQLLTS